MARYAFNKYSPRIRSGSTISSPRVEQLESRVLLSTYKVNSSDDRDNGRCDREHCSLREAIKAANEHPGTDRVSFRIPGFGIQTIRPRRKLPKIRDPLVIDGTTQLGFVGKPIIQLDGTDAGVANGLVITAGRSTVRGLIINSFVLDSILLERKGGDHIVGNFIGTDASGTAGMNGDLGVVVHSPRNTIGGTSIDDRNVISGNFAGVVLEGPRARGNVVQGNLIGTDVTGTSAVGNVDGVIIQNAHHNTVGGETVNARNIISGNLAGIEFSGEVSDQNQVLGNFIGTDITGTEALGNSFTGVDMASGTNNVIGGTANGAGNLISGNGTGILIRFTSLTLVQGNLIGTDRTGAEPVPNDHGVVIEDADANTIGGTTRGAGNVIAFNRLGGVSVINNQNDGFSTVNNAILSNSVFSNTGLGIDLGSDGVTDNDIADSDTGPNLLQNFPLVMSATRVVDGVMIEGQLNSTPDTAFRIEFFVNEAPDPSGFGEGEIYIGSADVRTDHLGQVTFRVTLMGNVRTGAFITATATDPNNNTSEFSQGAAVAS